MQYGVRLRTTQMQWDEFKSLLAGLMPETPLANIISIRSEKDMKVIKKFTPEQKRIRREWQSRQAKKMTEAEADAAMASISAIFKSMAGSQKKGG